MLGVLGIVAVALVPRDSLREKIWTDPSERERQSERGTNGSRNFSMPTAAAARSRHFFQQYIDPTEPSSTSAPGRASSSTRSGAARRSPSTSTPTSSTFSTARRWSRSSSDMPEIVSGSVDVVFTSNFFEHLPTRPSWSPPWRMPPVVRRRAAARAHAEHPLPARPVLGLPRPPPRPDPLQPGRGARPHRLRGPRRWSRGSCPTRSRTPVAAYGPSSSGSTCAFPSLWRVVGKQMFVVARPDQLSPLRR